MTAQRKMNAVDEIFKSIAVRNLENAIAICYRNREISYRELIRSTHGVANGLKRMGVTRENRVLMMLRDSPALVCTYLAAMEIGAVAVAINIRCSEEELRFYIEDSRCVCLVLEEEYLESYLKIQPLLDTPPQLILSHTQPALSYPSIEDFYINCASESFAAAQMSPDDMAFWVYTSGTTGTPKAAVHLQHDIVCADQYLVEVLGVTQGDRLFATSKLFFAYALGNCLFGALTLGATTILCDEWPSPEIVVDVIRNHRPTVFFSVPVFYRNLMRSGIPLKEAFSEVRVCVSAGERLPVSLSEHWLQHTAKPITEGYGTSECIYMVFSNHPQNWRHGSAGQVCPDVEVKLTDPHSNQLIVEAGQSGVLWVAMPALCDRYWNQQKLSNQAFHGQWFCTGDLFSFDRDGFYYHQGRNDDMLKISGQWVSPSEIEDAIHLPEIAEAAVVCVPDDDDLSRLAIFLVVKDSSIAQTTLKEKLSEHLQSRLALYKCPRRIYIVESLPRTANGKLQRHKLRSGIDIKTEEIE